MIRLFVVDVATVFVFFPLSLRTAVTAVVRDRSLCSVVGIAVTLDTPVVVLLLFVLLLLLFSFFFSPFLSPQPRLL